MFKLFRKQPPKGAYEEVSASNDLLSKDEKEEYGVEDARLGKRSLSMTRWSLPASLLLFALSILLLIAARSIRPSDNQCARQLSVWSPGLDAVEYIEYDLENKFDEPSIYRGPPTPARDKAWTELWQFGGVRIPPEKMHLLNRTLGEEDWRMIPDEAGGYVALLDVFHQIHCLDLVRMYTWLLAGNYAPPGQGTATRVEVPSGLRAGDVGNRMHVDHCIETLRKTLMCHGDVTPFLTIEDPKSPIGHKADFNVHQKCRDFGKIKN
ncbi:MAG: hypothetical protein M1839_000614 [Geoglossum umbratile]|nr:MAG: hypothetical protein M1839_000614 [Geoglossum umbratile]